MKRKERELKNQIDYEENKIAKKILRRYKFENELMRKQRWNTLSSPGFYLPTFNNKRK